MALIYLSLAWVAGIYLGSKFALPWALILSGLIPLPLLFVFRQNRRAIVLSSLCLFALFSGALLFPTSQPQQDSSHIAFYNGQEVEIKGIINAEPEPRDRVTHLHFSTREIKIAEGWQTISGNTLLFVPRYPAYHYGDLLQVKGKLEEPPQLDEFDYAGYLASQGIHSTMLYPKTEVLATGKGLKPLEWLYGLRNSLAQSLARVLPEPQASLAQGIILGIRYNIPAEVRDSFVRSGTAHLLAISGLHLSIVAGILLSIGRWLFGRRHYIYIWLAMGTISFYALLTGMNPPVVRGAIMASVFLLAELLGRQRTAITTLALAGAIMIGLSPRLLWDASFQLSFLAMAGLIFLAPPFTAWGRRLVGKTIGEEGIGVSLANTLTDSLAVTLAATIAVWPVVAHYFGIISLAGPLATFLTLPTVPAAIICGVLAGLIGLIFLPLAQIIGWFSWLFFSYILLLVGGFASMPISAIEVGKVSTTLLIIYYSALALAIWLTTNRRLREQIGAIKSRLSSAIGRCFELASQMPKRYIIPSLLILAILASAAAATTPDDKLHISFLDVGEGDSILIQKGSRQILIDGGPSPQTLTLGLGEKMPFWDRSIELVILTHPHADHLGGLLEVLKRYKVGQALFPDLDYSSPLYEEWLGLIRENGITYTRAQAGQRIDLDDDVVIEVLNPPTSSLTEDKVDLDNSGLVLRLAMGRVSFLFTADIGWETEFELIRQRARLASTVLKVAHHGSESSTTPEFLMVVDPLLAVISVGENRFGHPADEVIKRLEQRLGLENVLRTDQLGTIEFITNGERLWLRVEK